MPVKTSSGLREAVAQCVHNGVAALRSLQRSDGHWCGLLQGDSILESEYLLMKFILSQENEPMRDGSGRETLDRIAAGLRRQQRPDGTWGQYPGSDMDINASVKGYFALKLMGDAPDAPHMVAGREAILAAGGAERINTFSNFYLACLGQVSWNAVPSIPPEIIWLPRWFYFHMSKVSAWTRTMILPLAIVTALRPTRELPKDVHINELFIDDRARHRLSRSEETPGLWSIFFSLVDSSLKLAHRVGTSPFRRLAVHRCLEWILRRASQDGEAATDGLGAIFPPMVYIQVALQALGWDRSDPVLRRAEKDLDDFFVEKSDDHGDWIMIQPCFSPVWDTGYALYALTACGLAAGDPSVDAASAWLLGKECTFRGDWADGVKLPVDASGWFFEYHNAWYPDVDDTAQVAMALHRTGRSDGIAAGERGVKWLIAMQNDDGGWAAFDRTKHRQILEYVPFADHNAMQDPSCPDITGRILECLAWHGYTTEDAVVQQAIAYIKREQTEDGAWIGRWGVNYLYGTWQALLGPIRCGVSPDEHWVQRAGEWVSSVQKHDGSFGETADSYINPALKGTGISTPSQTAWGLMTMIEVFGASDERCGLAASWLCREQLTEATDEDPAGSWTETEFTGTGFPRVFYLRYHMYRLYFPLMAVARWRGPCS
ncbi:MAG: squalene--hopene cyclase [Phycisphaerae bacterium]|nr:squalene--hopene cyclase [Phycisphaerae bacterium]MBT5658132.1 squalene--hopene cyclase [Phycisphaerae bacterium]